MRLIGILDMRSSVGLACFVLGSTLPFPANGADVCQDALSANRQNAAPELFVVRADNGLEPVVPMMAIQVGKAATFAYLGQFVATGAVLRGAAAIKVAVKKVGNEGASADVGLKRQNNPGACRRGWGIRPIDFERSRQTVPISKYVIYHMTRTDDPPRLNRFHFGYANSRNRCIDTDDKSNGNRQQFLISTETPDQTAVLLARGVRSTGATASTVSPPAPDQLEVARFADYSRFTTHITTYTTKDRTCFTFSLGSDEISYSASVRITINDLEARGQGPVARPPEVTRDVIFLPRP